MILSVVKSPDPRLKKICAPAKTSSPSHRKLAIRLVETMRAHKAYGIAANQVTPGDLVRIIAVTTKEYTGAMFNPEIQTAEGPVVKELEACLSLRQAYAVPRSSQVTVSFEISSGEKKSLIFNGIGAVIVQHEIDHINGILASDYFDKESNPS